MHHKLTAVRVTEQKGEITVQGMTRSPRGTQVLFETLKVGKKGTDKAAFKKRLEAAITLLYAQEKETP